MKEQRSYIPGEGNVSGNTTASPVKIKWKMKKWNWAALLLVLMAGCKDPYDIELKPGDVSVLVVDGLLNVGQGPTSFRLTQAVSLQDAAQIKPVLQATVTVENSTGTVFPFAETGGGFYTHAQLPAVPGEQYRLRIKTNSKEYLSDYVEAKTTPAIDSITWSRDVDGLRIYASTHDATNNTRYYKWDFDETWEIRSYYTAQYEYQGGTNIVFSPNYRYRCWKYASSTTINLGSSAQLQSDVISETPIHFIPLQSERLGYRYSILVRQQSLTREAYQYFLLMKKNTESIGSIFDPQPSELKGNIRCISDPEEGVIGYLTASDIKQQRIFITANQANWNYPQSCYTVEVKNHPDSISLWVPTFLPYSAAELAPGVVDKYYFGPAQCVDCTARGGNLNMPSYW